MAAAAVFAAVGQRGLVSLALGGKGWDGGQMHDRCQPVWSARYRRAPLAPGVPRGGGRRCRPREPRRCCCGAFEIAVPDERPPVCPPLPLEGSPQSFLGSLAGWGAERGVWGEPGGEGAGLRARRSPSGAVGGVQTNRAASAGGRAV